MAKENRIPQFTTLCYVERGDTYLMLHRVKKENDVNKDKWIGIGGHLEEGESPEECIVREAMEETGLALQKLRFRGIVTFCFKKPETGKTAEAFVQEVFEKGTGGKTKTTVELFCGAKTEKSENMPCWDEWEYMCLFTAAVEEKELAECNEGELEWVKKERISQLKLWEGDRIFLRLLAENAPFFSLKLCYYGDKLVQAVLNGERL